MLAASRETSPMQTASAFQTALQTAKLSLGPTPVEIYENGTINEQSSPERDSIEQINTITLKIQTAPTKEEDQYTFSEIGPLLTGPNPRHIGRNRISVNSCAKIPSHQAQTDQAGPVSEMGTLEEKIRKLRSMQLVKQKLHQEFLNGTQSSSPMHDTDNQKKQQSQTVAQGFFAKKVSTPVDSRSKNGQSKIWRSGRQSALEYNHNLNRDIQVDLHSAVNLAIELSTQDQT